MISASDLAAAAGAAPPEQPEEPEEDCGVKGQVDLGKFLNKPGCECLNEADDHPYAHALNSGGGFLESDCDEQLILSLAFNQVCTWFIVSGFHLIYIRIQKSLSWTAFLKNGLPN